MEITSSIISIPPPHINPTYIISFLHYHHNPDLCHWNLLWWVIIGASQMIHFTLLSLKQSIFYRAARLTFPCLKPSSDFPIHETKLQILYVWLLSFSGKSSAISLLSCHYTLIGSCRPLGTLCPVPGMLTSTHACGCLSLSFKSQH